VIVVAVVGLAVSIVAGWWLADLMHVRARRPVPPSVTSEPLRPPLTAVKPPPDVSWIEFGKVATWRPAFTYKKVR
jgi:hypothetical protein